MGKDYFEQFKPIRNRLKKVGFIDVLERLYELMNSKRPHFVPEIYEFIYVNALIYCPIESDRGIDFQKEMTKILTGTVELHNQIDGSYIQDTDDPFGFMRKMYLNQEKSKVNHYINQFFRYYTIFSEPALSQHIENKIGISYYDFMLCSFWLTSKFINSYHTSESYFYAPNLSDSRFNRENMSKTLNILSIPYSEIKDRLKSEFIYDENTFLFHGNQHIKTPVIKYNGHLICLYAAVLLKQATAGVYYTAEIFAPQYNLNNPFGKGFEKYIGLLLTKLNGNAKFKITPELKYNRGSNKTSDWIIIEDSSIIFLECKTKRQVLESKLYSSGQEEEQRLQAYAAQEISKIYKVYDDYKENRISELPFDPAKSFIPLIVFLEDGFYLDINNEITDNVKNTLQNKGISSDIVDEFPFHIFSVSDFEYKSQIMFEIGFRNYFIGIKTGNISQDYIEHFNYIDYFSDDFERQFITPNNNNNS